MLRPARAEDAAAISALIHDVAPGLMVHPDGAGAERFLLGVAPPAIKRYLSEPQYRYQVCLMAGQLAGVIALRDNRHLFHLFVAPAFQRRGIARHLWRITRAAAIEAGNRDGFTVNSSLCAQPVYERFGFQASGPAIHEHGIAYVPMRLRLAA